MSLEQYNDDLWFRYYAETGTYRLYEGWIGLSLGPLVLHEGPGYLFEPEGKAYMQGEMVAITSFLLDAQETLPRI